MRLNRRQWIRAASAAIACVALPRDVGAQTSAAAPAIKLSPAQMREDLVYLQTQWAPLDQSFNDQQRVTFNQLIADAIGSTATSSTEDFALDVMRAVAIPRNFHTVAMVGRLLGGRLPIRTWWFAEGLFITSVAQQFADLLGARIKRLGTLSSEEALARVAPYISGTDQGVRYWSAIYLTCPGVLRRIGALSQINEAALTLRLRDGSTHVATLGPASTPDPGDRHELWSALVPDDEDVPGRWLHVLDKASERSPAYAKPIDVSTQWMGDRNGVLYIRSNHVDSQDRKSLSRKLLFDVIQGIVVPKRPRFVIVDLRFNSGGNFFDTILFAQALPKLIPSDGRIFVLISRATFSAALATAAMLKGADPDKVTFVGEPMGDNGHFWAEPGTKTLPNSGITVQYSTAFENYEEGCVDPAKCYWPTVAFGPRNISLGPDVRIDVTFADYAAGRDPILARALEMAR